ncbi:TPA: hypothetical protein U5E42_002349 [Yersinia enterocolitica]|nr:hypothetical protein [Yersinia enterocolitica]
MLTCCVYGCIERFIFRVKVSDQFFSLYLLITFQIPAKMPVCSCTESKLLALMLALPVIEFAIIDAEQLGITAAHGVIRLQRCEGGGFGA